MNDEIIKNNRKLPVSKELIMKQKIYETYNNVGKNNKMLETAIIVWSKLNPIINNLDYKIQLEIIHETTMMIYDTRIEAFNHMVNLPSNELPEKQ